VGLTAAIFEAFAETQQIPLSAVQIENLLRLDDLLVRWSQAVGLVGFRDERERFQRYYGEALVAARWLPPRGSAADLGTGGGSPALPLAIALPGLAWTFLEPGRKKAVFLEEALGILGRADCGVVRARVEQWSPETPLAVVTSRGLARVREELARIAAWLEPRGQALLFTGRKQAEELVLPPGLELQRVERLSPSRGGAVVVLLTRKRIAVS
jgi:16S rRNA (guanine527-N7)-methyltransferase